MCINHRYDVPHPFLLAIGVGIGYLARRRSFAHKTERGVQFTIAALLFVFGLSIGSDGALIRNLGAFGGQAVVIAVLATAGSLAAGVVAQRFIFGKGGRR